MYRDDYLAALRATGRDAEREAGRLSLDEVRQHLTQSVLPRLAADGIIVPPLGGLRARRHRFGSRERTWRGSSARATRSPRRFATPASMPAGQWTARVRDAVRPRGDCRRR